MSVSQREADRRFKERHPDRRRLQKREAQRRYRERHPERVAQIDKASRERRSDRRKAQQAEYYAATKEAKAEWGREYRSRPEVRSRRNDNELARRTRKRDQFVERVERDVLYEKFGGVCGICERPIEGCFHVDHIVPLSRGGEHSYANCQPAHPKCNISKKDKEPA